MERQRQYFSVAVIGNKGGQIFPARRLAGFYSKDKAVASVEELARQAVVSPKHVGIFDQRGVLVG